MNISTLRWAPANRQLADCLTKSTAEPTDVPKACLKSSMYRLMAEKTVDEIVSIIKKSDVLKCETMFKPLPSLASLRSHMHLFI